MMFQYQMMCCINQWNCPSQSPLISDAHHVAEGPSEPDNNPVNRNFQEPFFYFLSFFSTPEGLIILMLGYVPCLHDCSFNVIGWYTMKPKSIVDFYLLLLYARARPWPKVDSVIRSLCNVCEPPEWFLFIIPPQLLEHLSSCFVFW